jgi:hypothetical protein
MANATITVLEADGTTETDVVVLDVGRQAVAASKSVGLATEDKAVLDAIAASLALLDNVTQTTAAPTGADTALVVGIHPDSQNANGRAAAADGAPVTLSTEDLAEITSVKTAVQLIDDAIVADDAAFTPATTKTMMAGFQADETATDSVDEGDAAAARITLDRKQIMTLQPHTAGGLSVFRSLDLDETEEEVKATAGCLYKIRATNRTTSVRYLKLYNATAANTTVGTTTPIDTIPLPANASDYTVLTESFGGLGLTFDTALSMAVTTGFADNDTGAPGANDVIVSAYYK